MSVVARAIQAAVAQGETSAPAVVSQGFGVLSVDVARESWADALSAACAAGATFFDFLTAYDELADGFAVVAHVSTPDARDHLLVRARVPRDGAVIASVVATYRGAAWHERETHEMFGIGFTGNDGLAHLLLPAGFTGTPLRKDFVLASRVARAWPGEKDPADSTGKVRRRSLPPGVPADWPTGTVGDRGVGDPDVGSGTGPEVSR